MKEGLGLFYILVICFVDGWLLGFGDWLFYVLLWVFF